MSAERQTSLNEGRCVFRWLEPIAITLHEQTLLAREHYSAFFSRFPSKFRDLDEQSKSCVTFISVDTIVGGFHECKRQEQVERIDPIELRAAMRSNSRSANHEQDT
jgi:hypothetical protein